MEFGLQATWPDKAVPAQRIARLISISEPTPKLVDREGSTYIK